MNKAETIDQIARSADITKADAGRALDALEARIKAHSDAGERVMLRGLGSFSRGAPAQKTGRNPRTGLPLTYTAYHRVTGAPSCSESRLCGEISADTGLNANAAKRALDAFKGSLASALKKGDMLTLTGFGSFYVGKRAARNGRNPQTGATIRIAAAQVPRFRASKTGNKGGKFSPASALKDAVNRNRRATSHDQTAREGRLLLGWKNPAARPRSKRRRGGAPPAPFCCLSPPGIKGAMGLLCGGFYPKGARHNGFLCEPGGRAAACPALALCIRRRYVKNRHRCQRSATRPRTVARALNCPAATALAACEPQGLDGAAVGLGGAMKPEVVTRRRERSGTNMERAASRWRGYAFGALSSGHGVALQAQPGRRGRRVADAARATKPGRGFMRAGGLGVRGALAKARGLLGSVASPVTERSRVMHQTRVMSDESVKFAIAKSMR